MGIGGVVIIPPRAVLAVAALIIGVATVLWVSYTARQALTWGLVSAFLALALNPPVEYLQSPGHASPRGIAPPIIYLGAIGVLPGLGFLLTPPIVDQVGGLADAAPGYVQDLTRGRGPLGFLETKYHVVEKVRESVNGGGTTKFAGGASTVLSITKSVITAIVA